MLRIFLGLSIPSSIKIQLSALQGGVPGAQWVDPENYHITLKFIGDVDEVAKEDIAEALEDLSFPTFKINLQGIDIFSKGNDPHHLWVKPMPEEPILQLNRKIENHLENHLHLKKDTHKFTPHLTIAKLKNSNSNKVGQFMQWHNLFKTITFEITEYTLFQSFLTPNGSIYKPLDIFSLDAPE